MHIVVLSQLQGSPGTNAFLEFATAAGHHATLVNPLQLRVVAGEPVQLATRGSSTEPGPPEIVFTRMGGATPERAFDVLRAIELSGLPCVNDSNPLRIARDKIRSALELTSAGLPVPFTITARGDASAEELAAVLGAPPWVLKQPSGSKGLEVELLESSADLRARLEQTDPSVRLLLQRFVREAAGSDMRVFVVGGRAIAAMRRQARQGEWRSNLHQGGSGTPLALTDELAAVAEGAARALGLDVCGVDLLPSEMGPLVAEVNGSPGLAGLSQAVGTAPLRAVVDLLEQRARRSR